MERKYICPCGLTCCDCMFYKPEIYEAARRLKKLINENKLDMFLSGMSNKVTEQALEKHLELNEDEYWNKLGKNLDAYKKMPDFIEVLDGIVELQCHATCQESGGCSMAGNTKECGALKCIKSKGYEGCWECREYENCEHLEFLKNGYGHVINENLSMIKDKGFDAIQSRGNQYYAWQRKLKSEDVG